MSELIKFECAVCGETDSTTDARVSVCQNCYLKEQEINDSLFEELDAEMSNEAKP